MRQLDHSLRPKQPITFAAITVVGVAALLLGLGLIIFAHYHERAYVFLGLGAGGFIGGIAGIVGTGSKIKAALSYGVIALGMMGMIVGLNYLTNSYPDALRRKVGSTPHMIVVLNYLTNSYGAAPNQTHGYIVIALSIIAILAGIFGAMITQPNGGMAVFSSVIMLGVIASTGIVALIVGVIYLIVLQSRERAYLLLGAGAVCLIGGIACGIFAQRCVRVTSR